MESSHSHGYLCLVLDLTPRVCAELADANQSHFQHWLNGIGLFVNAYTTLNSSNQILVLAATPGSSDSVLFASEPTNSCDIGATVIDRVRTRLNDANADFSTDECSLAVPLTVAMCRMNRHRRQTGNNISTNYRILVMKISAHSNTQHLSLMNILFAAQKQVRLGGIHIDCCAIRCDCALMQQACDITGGAYLRVDELTGLTQHLLTTFLSDSDVRSRLQLPEGRDVDYRPVCFCHHKFVEVGWVCSVCLSVFCDFSPICSTCQTTHKFNFAKPKKRKKPGSTSASKDS